MTAKWLLWVPTLLIAAGVCGVEAMRVARPTDPLFATPFAYSLADAIEHDDVQRAYAFIQAGQDPNELITVQHADWTRGQRVLMPPLLWAVAARANHSAWMLLGFGARPSPAWSRNAICLATQLNNAELADAIRQYGSAGSERTRPTSVEEPCRRLKDGEAPLLAALEESGDK